MIEKTIFIGADGGGTKTKVLVEDQAGHIIGTGTGGASNIRLSVENAWKSIYDAIDNALHDTGIKLSNDKINFHIGLGLAGVSIIDAKNKFLNTPNPFKTLVLESDAHIACLGANDGGDGGIISIGTGVIGYLIDNGKSYRVGGWGFPHADTGGGAWLGMEITRLTFSWLDGGIQESEVLKNVFKHFNNDLSSFVQWANSANSTQFASLAPFVIEGIENKDVYSEKLLKDAAGEIDLLIKALKQKTPDSAEKMNCSLLGGIAPFLVQYLKTEHLSVDENENTGAKGAVHLVRQKFGKKF